MMLTDLNTDELRAKRANADRVKEFAKNLQSVNRAALSQQKRLPSSEEAKGINISAVRLDSKRERALEFARHVPKPKVKSELSQGGDAVGDDECTDGELIVAARRKGARAARTDNDDDDDYMAEHDVLGGEFAAMSKLDELEARHQDSRRQVEAIKRSLGMK